MDPTQTFLEMLKEMTGQAEAELLPFAAQWGPQVAAWKQAGMNRPVEELAAAAVMEAAAYGVRFQAGVESLLMQKFVELAF